MTSTILRRLVGVIASLALVLGWTAATSAPAEAKSTVWDRVAKCESGGNWKINTGNGYYGGLQFSRSTWRGYGGTKYASTANRATKSEQIAIARRTLAGQGPGAWPTCGRRAGLTRANGGADRNATPSSSSVRSTSSKSTVTKKSSSRSKVSTSSGKVGKKSVRVKSGDTLAKIARRNNVNGGWRAVYRLNRSRLDSPHRIYVGQVLRIRQ